MNSEKIIQILYKRLIGSRLTADEIAMLNSWVAENPDQRQPMIDKLSDPGRLADDYRMRAMIDTSRPQAEMERRLGIHPIEETPAAKSKWRSFMLKAGAVAACAAIIIGLAFLFRSYQHGSQLPVLASSEVPASPLRIEALGPGSSRAIVTTESGDTIHLSSPDSQERLAAKASEGPLQIDVPRGGEFVVTLEDSTRVWLNSASRLIYPAHFAADSRKVELEGEAYFEVTHNDDAPFIVESYGQKVRVYGTEFNIRAYPEDGMVYTTLSSGSISLTPATGGGEVFLSPGKQAVFDKESSKASIRNVDLERVTGWRHGRFVFEEQSLRQIMQDLSRWYDFRYEFADEDAAETIFMGSIPRYSNFKTAIAILEKSGGLSFKVKDDMIIISKQ